MTLLVGTVLKEKKAELSFSWLSVINWIQTGLVEQVELVSDRIFWWIKSQSRQWCLTLKLKLVNEPSKITQSMMEQKQERFLSDIFSYIYDEYIREIWFWNPLTCEPWVHQI